MPEDRRSRAPPQATVVFSMARCWITARANTYPIVSLTIVSRPSSSSRAHLSRPALAFLLAAGCVAAPLPIGSDTDDDGGSSASESTTASSASVSTSTTEPGGDDDTSPVAAACEAAVTAEACALANAAASEGTSCTWQTVRTILTADGGWGVCEEGRLTEVCVAAQYQGEGCIDSLACGREDAGNMFYREQLFGLQFLVDSPFCEDQPIGWSSCAWDPETGEHVLGPSRCACFCEGVAVLPPGFEDTLTTRSGCADLALYAHDDEDTIGISLFIDAAFVETARDTGKPFDAEIGVDTPDRFELRTGQFVTHRECNDALFETIVIDHLWTASSGTMTIHLEPLQNMLVSASVILTDVVFTATQPGIADVRIEHFEWVDVPVGWLPG